MAMIVVMQQCSRGVSPSEFDPLDGSFDEEDSLVLIQVTIVMVEMLPRVFFIGKVMMKLVCREVYGLKGECGMSLGESEL